LWLRRVMHDTSNKLEFKITDPNLNIRICAKQFWFVNRPPLATTHFGDWLATENDTFGV